MHDQTQIKFKICMISDAALVSNLVDWKLFATLLHCEWSGWVLLSWYFVSGILP
jgi:hypothetical protein